MLESGHRLACGGRSLSEGDVTGYDHLLASISSRTETVIASIDSGDEQVGLFMPSWINDIWPVLCAIYDWVFAWQTLVGAIVALIAAVRTIGVMREQMKSETTRHNDARSRKRFAARAQMPDSLSELGAYVRGCAARLMRAEALPQKPTDAISSLKEVIEFIDDDAAQRTFELVSWYQVFSARMSHDIPTPDNAAFPERQWDAALLQAYINSLFEYARNENDEVDTSKPSREEMFEALKNAFTLVHMVQHEDQYAEVRKIIERQHEAQPAK